MAKYFMGFAGVPKHHVRWKHPIVVFSQDDLQLFESLGQASPEGLIEQALKRLKVSKPPQNLIFVIESGKVSGRETKQLIGLIPVDDVD